MAVCVGMRKVRILTTRKKPVSKVTCRMLQTQLDPANQDDNPTSLRDFFIVHTPNSLSVNQNSHSLLNKENSYSLYYMQHEGRRIPIELVCMNGSQKPKVGLVDILWKNGKSRSNNDSSVSLDFDPADACTCTLTRQTLMFESKWIDDAHAINKQL